MATVSGHSFNIGPMGKLIKSLLLYFFYQNMPNFHNRYKSAERKISQKNVAAVKISAHFDLH
jgi:hypothetical protein